MILEGDLENERQLYTQVQLADKLGRALLAKTAVGEGNQLKRACVTRAQGDGTEINSKEIVEFVQGITVHNPD